MSRTIAFSAASAAIAASLAFAAVSWMPTPSATANNAVQTARPTRVATVNLEILLEGLDEQDVLQSQLDQLLADSQAQLRTLENRIEGLQADFEALADGSPEKRRKGLEIRETQIQIRARAESQQALISDETGAVLLQIFRKIRASVSEVAARDGWDVVVVDDSDARIPERAAQQVALNFITNRTLLYSADGVDITDTVRQYMNNRFQAGG